jgi:hypothetical protein
MSVDLIVYLQRSAMPSPANWQQAIRDAGFPVELDQGFDPDTFSGFLPCTIRGIESGFEYFAGPLSDDDRAAVGAPPGSDFSVTLVTHSDLRELACSVAAAGALTRRSGGILVDPQSQESFPAAVVLAWATQQFTNAEQA